MSPRNATSVDHYVGQRIRQRRLELNLSQSELGDGLGVTFQQIQKYEKGTNRVGASALHRLAVILDVEVGFFYQGAPASKGGGKAQHGAHGGSVMDDFVATPDGLMIARAFVQIKNPAVRTAIARFVREMGRHDDALQAAE